MPQSRYLKLTDPLDDWAQTSASCIACVIDGMPISYRELAARIDCLSRALLAAGVARGDRVATLSPPTPDYLVAFLATATIGAIWVGLNPRYRVAEIRQVLTDADPVVLIAKLQIGERSYARDIESAVSGTRVRRVIGVDEGGGANHIESYSSLIAYAQAISPDDLRRARRAVRPNDACLLVYTSGSTGAPKGAVLHHGGIVKFALEQNRLWPVDPHRIVNYFPINHVGCVVDVSVPTLLAKGTIVFLEQFDPVSCLKLMEREKITLWGSVPSVFQLHLNAVNLADFDLSALQLIVWEGAPMPEPVLDRLLELGLPLATNYSMTETTGAITVVEPTRDRHHLTYSVGHPFPGVELMVTTPNGDPVREGEAGEICARSPYNFLGYWRDPQATQKALTHDKFLRTGDLGRVNSDGSVTLVGRLKDMYKSGGYNVYPREIEAALESHPAVDMAAVIGAPDKLWGESGVAFVIPRVPIHADELLEYCREVLANYKVPKRIEVVADLPRLSIGKVDKRELEHRIRASGVSDGDEIG